MSISGKGPPYKPGPSIRGRLILDTVRGVPRARSWPRGAPLRPGSPRERSAKTFAAANRACKVTDAAFYGQMWEATRGTPLLPRDIMIANMYGRAIAIIMPDGTQIWSMAARNEVSRSLDVIGNTPGDTLRRGTSYWEPVASGGLNYVGAKVYRNAATGTLNLTTPTLVPYTHVDHDIGGWANLGALATGFTVIAGVTMVRVTANIGLGAFGLGNSLSFTITKNAALLGNGRPEFNFLPGVAGPAIQITATPFTVAPGDTIAARIQTGDTAQTIDGSRTWLSIEAVQ